MSKKSNNPTERMIKSFPVVVTDINESLGVVKAIVSVFGVIDDYGDIVHQGAFTKTLAENWHRVKILDQHKTDSTLRIVGRAITAREVKRDELPEGLLKRHPEATGGLEIEIQFLLDTPEGDGVFKRIKADALTEYSFAFDSLQVDYSTVDVDGKKTPIRNLRQVRLWEVSPVIWGANPATATVDAKTHPNGEKEMTPDGPQQRLGDVILASTIDAFTWNATAFWRKGYLTAQEYLDLMQRGVEFIQNVSSVIDEDILQRPIIPDPIIYYFGAGEPDDHKNKDRLESKEDSETPIDVNVVGSQAAPTPEIGNTSEGEDVPSLSVDDITKARIELAKLEVTNG